MAAGVVRTPSSRSFLWGGPGAPAGDVEARPLLRLSWHAACAGPLAAVALLVCAFPHWYAGAYFAAA